MTSLTRDPAPPARRPPALGTLAVRIQGGGLDGRVVRLQSPKCTVGSGPRCTLRVLGKGIRPLHCLIVRADRGMFVRRWSPDTRLNGRPFEQAPLRAGDRLTIGPLNLEVLPGGDPGYAANELPDNRGASPHTGSVAIPEDHAATDASAPDGPLASASAEAPPNDQIAEALRQQVATQRRRGRGLVEALRASRRHERELSARVTEALASQEQVQQQIEQLTAEARSASDRATDLEARLDELSQEKTRLAEEYQTAQRELQELREARLHVPAEGESGESPENGEAPGQNELEQRIDELSAELDAHKERERALIAQLKLSKERQNALRQQLQEASSEQTDIGAQMEARVAELEREKKELAELRREFQQERDRLAAERFSWEKERSQAPSAEQEANQDVESRSSVEEAEAAIAHLRELSLWSDERPTEEPVETPAEPRSSGSPVSFLEKYAPQLLDDEPKSAARRREPRSETPPKADEDESLDDYMAKLMQRVRGDEEPPPPRKPPSRSVDAAVRPSKPAMPTPPATAAAEAVRSAAETETQPDGSEPFRLQDIKRSRILPERRSNFAAMRELANQSAHTAISDYRSRRIVEEAMMTLLSGSICLAAGAIALYLAVDLRSPAGIGGAAALVLAAYFLLRGIWGLFSIFREGRAVAKNKPAKRPRPQPGDSPATKPAKKSQAAPDHSATIAVTADNVVEEEATAMEPLAEETAKPSQPT